ncbi:Anamorsin [Mortierella sp. AD094]|nr:Anamorsin [Mortierella sp. AD094]
MTMKRSHTSVRPRLRKRQLPQQPTSTPSSSSSSSPSSPPSSSSLSQPIALLLPQNQPNVTQRTFPNTPATGANNSIELTPNVTSTVGMVEIRIGVLLPYSLPNNLTQTLAFSGTSAIRLAAEEINANHLIPGAYITLVLKDSFNGNDPENSGAAQAIFSTVSLLQTGGGAAGVIGDVSSALSLQSALLTSRLAIPQCSYSAGSTQLSSKIDYQYFFRTIPTELMFGGVMLDFVASRGWKNIAVFYTGDSLGSQMMDNIEFQAAARGLTIGYRKAFWESGPSDVIPALDALQGSGQRIIVVAAIGDPQLRLMAEAVNRGLFSKDYVWLAINQITEPLLGENSNLKPTDLNGLFMFDNLLKLQGYPPYEKFLDKWAALNPVNYPYAGQRDISSNEPQAYSCMMSMAYGFAKATKGNVTALHLLAAGKLGDQLIPIKMNANYTGPGGPMVFDNNGDVVYGNFILYNFQNGQVVDIGTSYSGVFNLTSPPIYFDGTTNPPTDTVPLQVMNPKYSSAIGLVILCVAGSSIVFSLLTMLIVIVYRNAPVIKASSPLFCCLELCGFILLYISTIMSLDIPTSFLCMARPLTLNIGFLLVVSNIVAKNFRIYRIFHNIYVTKRVIKDSHLLRIVGTIMFGNLLIMLLWFLKSPPMMQQITMPDFTSYWTCSSADATSTPYFTIMFAYGALLLLFATYLAYKNRNVAANYNECRQIAFVIYNILLSGCLIIPTLFLPQDQFLTKFFLSTVVILFGTTFSVMFLFLPKLWELFTQIEKTQQQQRANVVNVSTGTTAPGELSDESSSEGFAYSGSQAWMNSNSNLAVLVPGAGNASLVASSIVASSFQSGRKGSVATLEEAKGETLKEAHMGYMGVKFQNRYFPFLSSWCMRRVALFPSGRYFTSFELGKPETGRTYTYVSVFIHSREPGSYILKVVGCSWYDILFQVRDEERLLYWYSLFDNHHQQTHNPFSSGVVSLIPSHGNISSTNLAEMNGLGHSTPATSTGGVGASSDPSEFNESDQTLSVPMDYLHVSSYGSGRSGITGEQNKQQQQQQQRESMFSRQKVLLVLVGAEDVSLRPDFKDLHNSILSSVGTQGSVKFEQHDRLLDSNNVSPSTYNTAVTGALAPSAYQHSTTVLAALATTLLPGGGLSLTEPVLADNTTSPLPAIQKYLARPVADLLRTSGFVETTIVNQRKATQSEIQGLLHAWEIQADAAALEGQIEFVEISAKASEHKLGAAVALPWARKRVANPAPATTTTTKPAASTRVNKTAVWTISANDQDDEDAELEDEDNLLDESDLIKPTKEQLEAPECGPNSLKKKKCKNCTCGMESEGEPDEEQQDVEMSDASSAGPVPTEAIVASKGNRWKESAITEVVPKELQPKSSCGNCYLGDAFRCGSCPYIGMPAFQPGEKVQLGGNLLKDDIDF